MDASFKVHAKNIENSNCNIFLELFILNHENTHMKICVTISPFTNYWYSKKYLYELKISIPNVSSTILKNVDIQSYVYYLELKGKLCYPKNVCLYMKAWLFYNP